MGVIIQGAGTEELRWDAQQLVIRLPRRVLRAVGYAGNAPERSLAVAAFLCLDTAGDDRPQW